MCWSLLINALTLAVELAVYDDVDNSTFGTREARNDIWKSNSYRDRANSIKHLLPAYSAHASARLGMTNPI